MAQVVDRALALLVAVVGASGPVSLTEVAGQTGVDKSTAQRLLASLVERGLLSRDAATRRYEVGAAMYGLAAAVNARSSIRSLAGPHLAALRDRSGETSSLHLLAGTHRVCVDGAESHHPVRRVVPLGDSIPLHVGPSGKVILAHLEQTARDAVYDAAGLAGPQRDAMERVLAEARAARVLQTENDRTTGIRAVSTPVFNPHGVIASITVAGPADRWTRSAATAMEGAVLDAATALSSRLGATL
ncbi:IclR family transcriptional regulator [Streptomyces sulfonofaciens]|uniref:IclR family transcriptional regulator n=1 Tax=Streptomyces sulfonofaciens TaxID=68272 RepID=A0A919G768_9ACTN|nr:IclR family transcriptional regulator [Streptomyces sulfonofaciens]GHH79382.1 IclR family transcriptional regulator [Streptomyces sulfonofaciens]